jgi:hypothetical protein
MESGLVPNLCPIGLGVSARDRDTERFAISNPNPIPLPAGVVLVDDWQADDPQPYRVVMGADRGIDGHDLRVRPSAIQFADGRIDDGHIERLAIHVDDCDRTLTAAQARELAAVLLAAADEVDGWARNADYAWADPAWHVDSETRTCCSDIGGHTQECRPVSIDASRLREASDPMGDRDSATVRAALTKPIEGECTR